MALAVIISKPINVEAVLDTLARWIRPTQGRS
jgi:hypothetical protein